MLVIDKNYIQMTMDFEKKAVICALLLRFRKKKERKKKERKKSEQGKGGFIR
jgi:hypothetical protein